MHSGCAGPCFMAGNQVLLGHREGQVRARGRWIKQLPLECEGTPPPHPRRFGVLFDCLCCFVCFMCVGWLVGLFLRLSGKLVLEMDSWLEVMS